MRNIVIIIAIFFWILNLISKSKKKQQQDLERKRIADLNKRVLGRIETEEYEPEQPTYNKRSAEEIATLFSERQVQAPATDYELAYASNDYSAPEKTVEISSDAAEHERAATAAGRQQWAQQRSGRTPYRSARRRDRTLERRIRRCVRRTRAGPADRKVD